MEEAPNAFACSVPCDFPEELDPFRDVYKSMPPGFMLFAGGWPAFLHFREHLQYDNPWREDGEIMQHDLDGFVTRNDRMSAYSILFDIFNKPRSTVDLVKIRDGGSVWNDNFKHHMTPLDATCKVTLRARRPGAPCVHLDAIGRYCKTKFDEDVLLSFDIDACKVGFRLYGGGDKLWLLHPLHTRGQAVIDTEQESKRAYVKYLPHGYEINGSKQVAKPNRCGCVHVT